MSAEQDDNEEELSQDPDENSNDNTQTASEPDKKLDKLYNRIPLLLAHLTDGNAERHNALDRLLKTFEKINELEVSLTEDGEHTPISLVRIYELASSGGSSEDIEELKAANEAYAEENGILIETIESLTFQIKRKKDQSADELIGSGKLSKATKQDVQNAITDIQKTINDIDTRLSILQNGKSSQEKPLHERLAAELSDFDDITADLLKALPAQKSRFGRLLTRCGLSYDQKDMETSRQLVVTVLKANKELSEVINSLTPAQEQLDKLHEVLTLLEAISGHDERQLSQYQDALEEIDRLGNKIDDLEKKYGTTEELEASIVELEAVRHQKQQENEEQNRDAKDRLQVVKNEIYAAKNRLKVLTEGITALEKSEDQSEDEKPVAELKEQVAALEEELKNKSKEEDQSSDAEMEKLRKQISDQTELISQLEAEHKTARASLVDATETFAQKEMAMTAQIYDLNEKIRNIENGLLVEKLEYEIQTLRSIAENYETEAENEREKRKAFEERVKVWVKDSESLNKDIEKWKTRALKEYTKIGLKTAGLATTAGAFGYAASGLTEHIPSAWFWGMGIGVPAAIGGIFGALDRQGDNWFTNPMRDTPIWDYALTRTLKYGYIGALATSLYIPLAGNYDAEKEALHEDYIAHKNDVEAAYREKILESCGDSPCMIISDEDGSTEIVNLSEHYAGESVIFTFPKGENSAEPKSFILNQPFTPQAAPE